MEIDRTKRRSSLGTVMKNGAPLDPANQAQELFLFQMNALSEAEALKEKYILI